MTVIRPREWGLTIKNFRKWVLENNAMIQHVTHIDITPVDREEEFYFVDDQDLVAFKLTFKKEISSGFFYYPYIPKIK